MNSNEESVRLLKILLDNGVQFVVVGGLAGMFHGADWVTEDVDICAPLDDANLQRLLDALRPIRPRLRMRPDKMPLPDSLERLRGTRNLYLVTDSGQIATFSGN